jgi:hypothetical protein
VVLEAEHFFEHRKPGEWYVADLPLSRFRELQRFPGVPDPLVACMVLLDSQKRDVGLTVDRIWVTRGQRPGPFPE